MALGWKKTIELDDPRFGGYETTYQSSRGGWFKAEEKPVPGEKKEGETSCG
ncbi:hypothetical protein [Streptomyces scabiei]|uniref:hypothetical protein n=1 Tax=Streptomyces scabiei TaxID=1930 RepID=UPI001B30E1F1|nr:hypothetical protein [Streptomyces sp. LBUM 1475]